jgi:signal transduction histidine kinase/DNA-binding response OmpR family regulator
MSGSELPLRVLLVEDDEISGRQIKELLRSVATQQYSVTWVDTYESARLNLEQHEFDVCLLDFHIDGRTGLELLEGPLGVGRVPFLFLTACEEHEVDVTVARAGAADYLVKQFLNGPLLERAIRYALERKATEWQLREAQHFTQSALDALQCAHQELEARVSERTSALSETNLTLQAEVADRQRAEKEIRRRVRQQEAVAELGQRALAGIDLQTLYAGAASLVSATLHVDLGWFFEKIPNEASLVLKAQVGFSRPPKENALLREGTDSQSGFTLLRGDPVISVDITTETRFTPARSLRREGVISSATVPVRGGDSYFGILGVGSRHPYDFNQNDIHFLQSVANVLGAAISRSQIENEVHQLNEELRRSNAQLKHEVEERQMALAALRETADLLVQAREQADTANRAKSEFLSRMSHELRTPLNSILGFGQILSMQDLSEEQQSDVEHILKAGRHLLELINEVLDIARIEAGRMAFSPEPVLAGGAAFEAFELLRPLAAQRDIHLINELDPYRPDFVLADQQRLKQVLINFVANAIKYNREGGCVWLSGRQIGEFMRLEVRDTGAGLTPEEISRLFVPFERLDAARTRVEGTGIGLALCKRLVEAMDGRIGVDSEPGHGSTFWLELPVTTPPGEGLPLAASRLGVHGNLSPGCAAKSILYIEDNLSNLAVMTRALNTDAAPFKIITAMQGSIGLDMARQHRPDLILLDVHLPDIEGDEVLKRLCADPLTTDIPVVVLSADATPGHKERLQDAGAAAFLTKPLDLKLFFEVLDQNLRKTNLEIPDGNRN